MLIIKGELTDLNRYLKTINNNRYKGNSVKQDETNRVYLDCKKQQLFSIMDTLYPVVIKYRWYSKDNRMDVDNVAFAKKFINDGLVKAGILKNDSRKFVKGFMDEFYIDKENPRVEVEIIV